MSYEPRPLDTSVRGAIEDCWTTVLVSPPPTPRATKAAATTTPPTRAATKGTARPLRMALGSLLYDVKPLDPVVFTTAPVMLGLAAMAATWIPARRATRVTPLTALRH